ncbi:MAG TPA: hypothetical protein EYH30_01740 [Anaerolineales bacterium]|nr:hypothetical protein [Anaerolineae bacterium]HIQ00848.1 hypothetical protein [Anaerolineales bacterium]
MLSRLLELLGTGGTHRVPDLARELETTPELVEMMLEDLTRMGHLKLVGGECVERCAACPLAGMCAVGPPSSLSRTGGGRVWTLTEGPEATDDKRSAVGDRR